MVEQIHRWTFAGVRPRGHGLEAFGGFALNPELPHRFDHGVTASRFEYITLGDDFGDLPTSVDALVFVVNGLNRVIDTPLTLAEWPTPGDVTRRRHAQDAAHQRDGVIFLVLSHPAGSYGFWLAKNAAPGSWLFLKSHAPSPLGGVAHADVGCLAGVQPCWRFHRKVPGVA